MSRTYHCYDILKIVRADLERSGNVSVVTELTEHLARVTPTPKFPEVFYVSINTDDEDIVDNILYFWNLNDEPFFSMEWTDNYFFAIVALFRSVGIATNHRRIIKLSTDWDPAVLLE